MDATEAAVHFALALQRHGERVRVLSPEDTAVFKMLFYRAKDLVDVERLLSLMREKLDVAYVRTALVETVGESDYRVIRWDQLTQKRAPDAS